jgi:multisubunit Na+/H+ antiporter MnhB subunit
MTVQLVLDIGLAALMLTVAAWTIATRQMFAAVIGFVAYGLLLALAWVRLGAIDIALTEAAIGSGVTGALLLRATARGRGIEAAHEPPSAALRLTAAVLCTIVTAGLAALVLFPADPAPTLAPAAAANLPATGLGNPVTAVLLAYRAIDTFLEKVVVLLALVGVWSLAPDRCWGGAPTLWQPQDPDGVLRFLAQVLPPIGIVVAIYILWNGADNPGGAFQASAMLAAMWMLTVIAGLSHVPRVDDTGLRLMLVAGAAVFLAVGLAGFPLAGAFLAYPAGYAKALIIAIEVVMTLSVAATLLLLVAGPPQREAPR